MPKTELVQKFHVLYVGMTTVSRPIGTSPDAEAHLRILRHIVFSWLPLLVCPQVWTSSMER